MPLSSGTLLGPYEILSPLGAGGMGEGYKARDSRLGREVAIKVLPAELMADEGRRRRFMQEARAASALNYPNIITINDISQDGGVDFLVMEYVHGQRRHYFYARGNYEVAVPPGRYRIEAVRGICHQVAVENTELGAGLNHQVDLTIAPLEDLRARGWYSGNTHTHYHLEIDEDPDDRLCMVPPAEDLDVSAISYLIRSDSPVATR